MKLELVPSWEWAIRQHARLNKGAEWVNVNILISITGLLLAINSTQYIILAIPLQYIMGYIMIHKGLSQKELAYLRKWLDPDLDARIPLKKL